jgi:hypothetical protein
MSAGLPGAGLGALLYLLLVLLLPIRSLLVSPATRDWSAVGRQMAIVAAMVGMAALETELALWLGFVPQSKFVRAIPALMLATVMAALELVRGIIWLRRRMAS